MYNENTKKAAAKYRAEKMHRLSLDLPNEEYNDLKAYCDANGEPVRGFIRRIIKENINK